MYWFQVMFAFAAGYAGYRYFRRIVCGGCESRRKESLDELLNRLNKTHTNRRTRSRPEQQRCRQCAMLMETASGKACDVTWAPEAKSQKCAEDEQSVLAEDGDQEIDESDEDADRVEEVDEGEGDASEVEEVEEAEGDTSEVNEEEEGEGDANDFEEGDVTEEHLRQRLTELLCALEALKQSELGKCSRVQEYAADIDAPPCSAYGELTDWDD